MPERMIRKNPREVCSAKKSHVCIECGAIINKGDTYFSKPYISPRVTSFWEKNELLSYANYMNHAYVGLTFCSMECFIKCWKHKNIVDYVLADKIIERKLKELKERMDKGEFEYIKDYPMVWR